MEKIIPIPKGYEAKIEGDKIFLVEKESEDERIRKALINVFAAHKDYEIFFGVSVEDIIAYLDKQKEQNWSKEMGSLCLDAIGLLRNYGEGVAKDSPLDQKIKRADAFLVDLYHEAFYPKTYNPRPDLIYKPAEWSEEDEDRMNVIVNWLAANGSKKFSGYKAFELLDWIKSLRSKPHWKPREDHFQGLRRGIMKMEKGSDAWNSLTDLYEQLEKL